jgi:predicted outer membrane repeat protein
MRAPRSAVVCCLSLTALLGGVLPSLSAAPTVIRVSTSAQLQSAFRSVPDGGVIELAAGRYVAVGKGFSIANPRKGFTVRAAAGANVALDGQGTTPILRFKNGDRSKGKLVTFQQINFQNGASIDESDAGGVTLAAAQARFVMCNFLANKATGRTTGGGAVRLSGDSAATFARTSFRNNSSGNRGGAIEVIGSAITVQGGEFTDNHVNLLNHKPTSPGGAIYVLDGTARITDAHFERNEAGWTGGAIYAFGTWRDPVTTPRAEVTVVRSTFVANRAVPHPCCATTSGGSGGAIHVEDQAIVRVYASQFLDNAADQGGALDSYRAAIEVSGSAFHGNRTPLSAGRLGAGGAISIASNDSAVDALNRPPGRLTVSDSLIRGGTTVGNTGGCLLAEGDWARIYGVGVPAAGSLAENRSRIELRRVAFADCDVVKSAAGGGFGGAIAASMVDLVLDGSILFDSDARGDGAGGGGLSLQRESTAVITSTTFAHDTAEKWGGAVFLGGSTAQIQGCRFFRNEVSPGVNEGFNDSRGAALYTIPQLGGIGLRSVGGMVVGSLFSENAGVAVWDVLPAGGPANEVRYNANRFYSTTFGDRVYVNNQTAPNGVSATALNSMRAKSDGGNSSLLSAPRDGVLLAVPPGLGFGAPASTLTFLVHAWSGTASSAASLAGQPLASRAGLLTVTSPGTSTLTVDGTAVAAAEAAASACTAGPTLCLRKDRFLLSVQWRDASGKSGAARAASVAEDAGYFWIDDEKAPALIVQVTDKGLADGGARFFRGAGKAGALGFTVTLTDARTGAVRSWSSEPEIP